MTAVPFEIEPRETTSWYPREVPESHELLVPPSPTLVPLTASTALLYRGRVALLSGPPGTGKSSFAQFAALDGLRQRDDCFGTLFDDSERRNFIDTCLGDLGRRGKDVFQ